MQSWRKFLALIVVMVFAPATVVAAMPLHLCFGADGHRAIEGGFTAEYTSAENADIHIGKAGTSHFKAPSDCVDLPLIKIGAQAHARADTKKAESHPLNGVSLDAVSVNVDVSRRDMSCNAHAKWAYDRVVMSVDPFLAVLATTVLLN
jgi:hypothetical protein